MKTRFISYLDLMCCGFGGAVLMFLVTAVADVVRTPTNDLIFIRCRHNLESKNPRAEIAIEYQVPGSEIWILPNRNDPIINNVFPAFSAVSQKGGGSESVLVIRSPKRGEWRFRALLVNYPNPAKDEPKEADISQPCSLQFEVKGANLEIENLPVFELARPGETSEPFSIWFKN